MPAVLVDDAPSDQEGRRRLPRRAVLFKIEPCPGRLACMALTATLDKVDGAVVVAVSGELDLGTASVIQDRLGEAETLRPPVLILDLSTLDFMDSTGLRIILAADANARRDDRRLVVVRGPAPVHRVFLIARLDDRLEFVDDVSAALAAED